MPRYVVERVAEALNSRSRAIRGSRVHLFGMAYKPNVSDVRESPAIDVAELLLRRGAAVTYSDPFVPAVRTGTVAMHAVSAEHALADGIDCAVITTDHEGVDYLTIARRAPLVVDTRNALAGIDAAPSSGCSRVCRNVNRAVVRSATNASPEATTQTISRLARVLEVDECNS